MKDLKELKRIKKEYYQRNNYIRQMLNELAIPFGDDIDALQNDNDCKVLNKCIMINAKHIDDINKQIATEQNRLKGVARQQETEANEPVAEVNNDDLISSLIN